MRTLSVTPKRTNQEFRNFFHEIWSDRGLLLYELKTFNKKDQQRFDMQRKYKNFLHIVYRISDEYVIIGRRTGFDLSNTIVFYDELKSVSTLGEDDYRNESRFRKKFQQPSYQVFFKERVHRERKKMQKRMKIFLHPIAHEAKQLINKLRFLAPKSSEPQKTSKYLNYIEKHFEIKNKK